MDRARRIRVRNYPGTMDGTQMRQLFGQCGRIVKVDMSSVSGGDVIVEFDHYSAVGSALKLDGMENYLDGRKLSVTAYDPSAPKPKAPEPPVTTSVLAGSSGQLDLGEAQRVFSGLREEATYRHSLEVITEWIGRGLVTQYNAELFYNMLQSAFTRIGTVRTRRTERAEQIHEFAHAMEAWEEQVEKERAERRKKGQQLQITDQDATAKEEADLRAAQTAFRAAQKKTGSAFNKKQKKQLRDWARKADEVVAETSVSDKHSQLNALIDSDDDTAASAPAPPAPPAPEPVPVVIKVEPKREPSPPPPPPPAPSPKAAPPVAVDSVPVSLDDDMVKSEEGAAGDAAVKSEAGAAEAVDTKPEPVELTPDAVLILTAASIFLASRPLHGATLPEVTNYINTTIWMRSGKPVLTVPRQGQVARGAAEAVTDAVVEKVLKSAPAIFGRSVRLSEGTGDIVDSYVAVWKVLILS